MNSLGVDSTVSRGSARGLYRRNTGLHARRNHWLVSGDKLISTNFHKALGTWSSIRGITIYF